MKKLLSMILALCLAVSLAACAKPAEKEPTEPTATASAAATEATKPTEAATTQSVAPTIATAEAPEFATDPSEGETDVIASEVTEASTPATTPAIATKAPTEATKQLGSTPKKPITVVTATASPTAKPATTTTSAPTTTATAANTTAPATQPTSQAKPGETAAPTAPTESATVGTVAPGSLAGKTLTVYGLGVSDPQVDYGSYYDEAYKRMMRTAADEWAAMNGVTIRYMGSYDQNTVVSSYGGAGDPCDLVIPMNNLGDLVEIGFASPFTEAEYKTLAALVGDDRYLDVLSRRDQSYGIVLPWAGNMMVYFNQSMFEKYNVKSPLEYYNEGNWTWESFAKCMAEITRDLDGDGTTDIYGLPGDSWINLVNPERRDTFTGELLSTIDDPWIQDLIAMKYDAFRITGSSRLGENNIKTNTGSPVYAMEISACEAYDPQDVFQVSAGGDALIAVPLPRWEGEDGQNKEWVHLTQMTAHIFSGTKEREAVFDLLCYLTKCGMKYMADCSLGAISCDYTGIQGITDGAKQWKADFAADLQQRKTELQKLSCYDEAYVAKVTKSLSQADEWFTYKPYNTYIQYFNILTCIEIYEKPPAESVPLIKEKYLAALESYNKLYFS